MLTRTALMLVIGQLVNVVPLKVLYLICVIFFEAGSAICGAVRLFSVGARGMRCDLGHGAILERAL